MQRSLTLFVLLLTIMTHDTHVEDAVPGGSAAAQPCASPNHRAFDFWIGVWDVTANGQPAGVNRIEVIDGGCALLERWTSARGNFTGHSLNSFSRTDGQWHQTWVDSGGTRLELAGGRQDRPDGASGLGPMVLEGEAPDPEGVLRRNRITWTPGADGSVGQHWEVHDGETWNTAFDGQYRRRTAPE